MPKHHGGCDYPDKPFTDPNGQVRRRVWSYRDTLTGYFLRVAPDGRHLAAIDAKGHLVWTVDPHAGLPDYRQAPACVYAIGSKIYGLLSLTSHPIRIPAYGVMKAISEGKTGHYMWLAFDNSQFGLVDIWTGKFMFMGQN